MKINLNPNLLQSCTNESALRVANRSGLSYPTVWHMSNGSWNEPAMKTLCLYLEALGIGTDALSNAKFTDIFEIKVG